MQRVLAPLRSFVYRMVLNHDEKEVTEYGRSPYGEFASNVVSSVQPIYLFMWENPCATLVNQPSCTATCATFATQPFIHRSTCHTCKTTPHVQGVDRVIGVFRGCIVVYKVCLQTV